jgi:ribonuclease D
MLQLARSRPATAEELRGIEDIHPVALSRYGSTLLETIAEAAADQAPVAIPEQLDEQQKAALKQMRQIVQQRSTELDIEPALLASRKELEKLIRALGTGSPVPERFLGWRKAIVTDQLTSV